MQTPSAIQLGGGAAGAVSPCAAMLNRHGLVTGATGTGKTVTLQVLAEQLSRLGVPVFAADVKGDLCGIAERGRANPKLEERIARLGIDDFCFESFPVALWDLFGKSGTPVRITVSDLGPLLLARLLQLNDTQTGVIYAAFKIADDNGLLLLDLADLRTLLAWMGENSRELKLEYGNLSPTSIGAIQRALLVLDQQGAEQVFGEPALALEDLMARAADGRGVINILDATTLVHSAPDLYACFLIWLLAELFENLPERGDADLPVLALFFDEAHLLFKDAPKPLLDKIEQVVRLIRSKGVGVFFITQSPLDVPLAVLGQLGLKIQHALRAFTPRDQKAVRVVAESFRANPAFDTAAAITELATGEALVSALDAHGQPTPVERTLIRPPAGQIGPLATERRQELLESSALMERYRERVDRRSAHEVLRERAQEQQAEERSADEEPAPLPRASTRVPREPTAPRAPRTSTGGSNRQGIGEAMIKSVVRSVGTQLGRQIVRGVLGSLLGGRR